MWVKDTLVLTCNICLGVLSTHVSHWQRSDAVQCTLSVHGHRWIQSTILREDVDAAKAHATALSQVQRTIVNASTASQWWLRQFAFGAKQRTQRQDATANRSSVEWCDYLRTRTVCKKIVCGKLVDSGWFLLVNHLWISLWGDELQGIYYWVSKASRNFWKYPKHSGKLVIRLLKFSGSI